MAGLRGLSPATPPEGQPGPGPCETLRNSVAFPKFVKFECIRLVKDVSNFYYYNRVGFVK